MSAGGTSAPGLQSIAAYAGEMGCATQILPPADGITTLAITPPINGRGDDLTGDVHIYVAQHPDAIRWMVAESITGAILDPAPNEKGPWAWIAESTPESMEDLQAWVYKLWVKVTKWRGVAYTVDPELPLDETWAQMRHKFDQAVWQWCNELERQDAELAEMARKREAADA